VVCTLSTTSTRHHSGQNVVDSRGAAECVHNTISALWINNWIITGAIIGDGDRKSWDPRAPVIWDNFSIFRTNCAILTSYIRANPGTCRELSRGCCHVAWSNGESWETWRDYLAYFSQRWQGIRQGIRTRALICSFMLWANGKGGFVRVENKTSISRWEWIIRSARASCKLTRMFLRLFWLKNIARKLSALVSS